MMRHEAIWKAPSPLWDAKDGALAEAGILLPNRPAILRFSEDTFMDDFFNLVKNDPGRLKKWIALPETWSRPMTDPKGSEPKNGKGEEADDKPDFSEFKLYQPVQQRYYLVTSSLVCRRPGLPDRKIDPGKQERAGFVVRRLMTPDPGSNAEMKDLIRSGQNLDQYEHAFIMTPDGGAWQKIGGTDNNYSVDNLVPDEEQLPMFAVNFSEDDGRSRRILGGLIPVGKREAYFGAGTYVEDGEVNHSSAEDELSLNDPRMNEIHSKVIEPWKRLVEEAEAIRDMKRIAESDPSPLENELGGEEPPPGETYTPSQKNLLKTSREKIQTTSWYMLLDFAYFLKNNLDNVWDAVLKPQLESSLNESDKKVFKKINETIISPTLKNLLLPNSSTVKSTLRSALVAVSNMTEEEIDSLESVQEPYNRDDPAPEWPNFLFPFADPEEDGPLPPMKEEEKPVRWNDLNDLEKFIFRIELFAKKIEEALPAIPSGKGYSVKPLAVKDVNEGWFRIRCVYNRPKCPLKPYVISREATIPFQLAGFFDPDAPARPVRIPLPADVSPAGLRKFNKNTAFMISDMLCGHIKRIRKLSLGDLVLSVLPWPFHKDLPEPGPAGSCTDPKGGFGMMCSLSIPIVTLCALILLIIIAKLFDTFFRWFPFLFTCFKIPGLSGKKQ